MTNLTKDTPVQFECVADEITERWKIDAGLSGSLFAGQIGQLDGTAPQEVKNVVGSAISDFAGILLQGGVAGDVVEVRRRGVAIATVSDLVSAGDEGVAVYAIDNNMHALTKTTTVNMPIGTIARVITVGTGVANGVAVAFEADGLTHR